MNELQFPDIIGRFMQGQQIGQEQRKRKTIADYAQAAIGGDQEALGQVFKADPETGFQFQRYGAQQKAAASAQDLSEMERLSKIMVASPEPVRQQLYGKWREGAVKIGLPPNIPEQYDPGFIKVAEAIAGRNPAEGYTLSPGSARFGPDNQVVAQQPFAPKQPEYVLSHDGTQWLPKPTGPQGGAPSSGGFGIAETDNYVRNILGKVGSIDPSAPPEQLAQVLLPHLIQQESGGNPNAVSPKGAQGLTQVMPATGQDPGFGVQPLRDRSPQENVRFGRDYLTAMLKRYPGRPDLALAAYNAGPGVADRFAQPQASASGGAIPIPGAMPKKSESDIEKRIGLAQQMGASQDDIRRMVIGREGAAAGAKPLPVGALKELLDVQDATAGAGTLASLIKKNADRMQSGALVVGPANSIGARLRTGLGMSNANDVNITEFKADMKRVVNESLRLNKGVQTEGDAQRAADELMAADDQATAARALRRLAELNARAAKLQQAKQALIRKNYGQDSAGNPAASSAPAAAGGWSIQRVD